MKPVLKSPAWNFGCASKAAWNGMFELMPRIANAFKAWRIFAMALGRSAAWTISLAIIES